MDANENSGLRQRYQALQTGEKRCVNDGANEKDTSHSFASGDSSGCETGTTDMGAKQTLATTTIITNGWLRRFLVVSMLCLIIVRLLSLRLHDMHLKIPPRAMGAGAAAIMSTEPHSSSAYAERVRSAMVVNFGTYWRLCRGYDEYEPAIGKCHNWFRLGLTAIDSIDTLLVMGLHHEYSVVRNWAASNLDVLRNNETVSIFELVIRAVGGLNSAYMLTGDRIWLQKAHQVGISILPAFNTTSGCPTSEIALNIAPRKFERQEKNMFASTAEVGTLQLEFRTLSLITGDKRFAAIADKCMHNLVRALPEHRVVPIIYNVMSNDGMGFQASKQTIGAHTDSFVEMLLKTWVAYGKDYGDMNLKFAFENQVEVIFQEISAEANGTLYLGTNAGTRAFNGREPSKTMEHLACFFPGVLALAAHHGMGGGVNGTSRFDYINRARRLAKTCYMMSRNTVGLAPEISRIRKNGSLGYRRGADHSFLRPEIIESIYVLYAVTGDRMYQEWGKRMWDDIQRSGTLKDGDHAGLLSSSFELKTGTPEHRGKLHSFVLAETLKYFFLLFRDKNDGPVLDLKEWVFNTEAHPVPVFGTTTFNRLVHPVP